MELQELVERIERWKQRMAGGEQEQTDTAEAEPTPVISNNDMPDAETAEEIASQTEENYANPDESAPLPESDEAYPEDEDSEESTAVTNEGESSVDTDEELTVDAYVESAFYENAYDTDQEKIEEGYVEQPVELVEPAQAADTPLPQDEPSDIDVDIDAFDDPAKRNTD